MIGQTLLRRSLAQSRYGAQVVSASNRSFAGGGNKPKPIDPKTIDYDILFVGGINAAALLKHTQQHDDAHHLHLKMGIICEHTGFILPQAYFSVCHSHVPELKLESGTVSAQVDSWSKIEANTRVTKLNPTKNTVELSNGKTFTYKALVLAPGFDHSRQHIKGLDELSKGHESNNVFTHILDHKTTVSRNFLHGWNNTHGDLICYSPKFPYKGEGTDFYALYYEHFMRQDKLHGRATNNARIQYWTPNKEIYRFPYANEVALEECHKRGIDVMFGWEMLEVKTDHHQRKIAVFKNVDTGAVIEKDFNAACINPPSKPHQFLVDAGLTNQTGGIDVNKYTLQHKTYDNIFAFGDAVGFETTRTHSAAMAQNPIVKNNVLRFLQGKEINGIYDGYTFMPFLLGHSYASNFQHLHDYEPATMNHWVPQYGIFAKQYFNRMIKSQLAQGEKYSSFKKDHGPPHGHYPAEYDELEHNEYLKSKGVAPADVIHPNTQARLDALSASPAAHHH